MLVGDLLPAAVGGLWHSRRCLMQSRVQLMAMQEGIRGKDITMDYTIEVINVPVSDIDRAKAFYADTCGFPVDLDSEVAPGVRIVQITPPGSRCSIALTQGLPLPPGVPRMEPGSLHGVQICVTDITAAHAELSARGVDISPVQHVGPSGWEEGKGDTWNSFAFFSDPDGNSWVLQEAPAPLSER